MAMVRKQKAVTHGLRYNAELNNRIEAATKKGGFSSTARSYAQRLSGSWPAGKAASMRRNSGSLRVWIAWPEKFAICG